MPESGNPGETHDAGFIRRDSHLNSHLNHAVHVFHQSAFVMHAVPYSWPSGRVLTAILLERTMGWTNEEKNKRTNEGTNEQTNI